MRPLGGSRRLRESKKKLPSLIAKTIKSFKDGGQKLRKWTEETGP